MKKFIVETYYTCTFKTIHELDDINEHELSKIDKRNDGKVEVIEVKLNNRKTKNNNTTGRDTQSDLIYTSDNRNYTCQEVQDIPGEAVSLIKVAWLHYRYKFSKYLLLLQKKMLHFSILL